MTRSANDAPTALPQRPYDVDKAPSVADRPAHQALFDWWLRQRGDAPAAPRRLLDPIDLRAHLGFLVLIECLDDGRDFRYRLIGTRVVEAFGRDNTGRTVSEIYADDAYHRDVVLDICRTVVGHASPVRALGDLRTVDRDFRRVDSYFLPLARDDGSIGWILNQVLFDEL